MIIRVVSSLNDLIEALAFSLFLSLRLSLGTMKLLYSGVVHPTKSTFLTWVPKRSHGNEWDFHTESTFCPIYFQKLNFGVRLTFWPIKNFVLLIFIKEEHVWGFFPFSNRSFKFQFLHILWKQNVRQHDKEGKINYFKLSSCWERNPGGETLKGRIEAVWRLNMFIFNRRAI